MNNSTPFGKELRKIRIDESEVLSEMAKRLGISIAYLSSIESGTRNIPVDFVQRIKKAYSLDADQQKLLELAKIQSEKKIVMDFTADDLDPEYYETALILSENYFKLDKKRIVKLKKLLTEEPTK